MPGTKSLRIWIMNIQEQIDRILKDKGISRYQLAKDTGINESQLSRFFSGKVNLSYDKIELITVYLNCEIRLTPQEP